MDIPRNAVEQPALRRSQDETLHPGPPERVANRESVCLRSNLFEGAILQAAIVEVP